jgi:hypothetical protein
VKALKRPLLFGGVVLAGAGCISHTPTSPESPVCTAVAVPALSITVLDAATARRVCDASVVAVDGAFQEDLRAWGSDDDCRYLGPTERPGSYEVRATKPGYRPAVVPGVRVDADECHVKTVAVTLFLER